MTEPSNIYVLGMVNLTLNLYALTMVYISMARTMAQPITYTYALRANHG